jgi:hypothetical protein
MPPLPPEMVSATSLPWIVSPSAVPVALTGVGEMLGGGCQPGGSAVPSICSGKYPISLPEFELLVTPLNHVQRSQPKGV